MNGLPFQHRNREMRKQRQMMRCGFSQTERLVKGSCRPLDMGHIEVDTCILYRRK